MKVEINPLEYYPQLHLADPVIPYPFASVFLTPSCKQIHPDGGMLPYIVNILSFVQMPCR